MKLVFLDIDGTLTLPGENTPPRSALAAMQKARDRGHRLFLCTGRNPDMLRPLLQFGFDGMISCGGGYVAVTAGENLRNFKNLKENGQEQKFEVLFDCPMTNEQRDLALDVLHRNGVFCTIEARDGSWGDENIGEFLKDQPKGNSEIERWRKALSENLNIRPMSEYDGSPVYKIVVMCREASQLDEARALLERDFRFVLQSVPSYGCVNGELINRKFDKGLGVRLIRERFDVPEKDTFGFGDSMNDLEMIQTVGTGVCMANGAEALKQKASLVCPSVSEDGLAWAFEKLNLI